MKTMSKSGMHRRIILILIIDSEGFKCQFKFLGVLLHVTHNPLYVLLILFFLEKLPGLIKITFPNKLLSFSLHNFNFIFRILKYNWSWVI